MSKNDLNLTFTGTMAGLATMVAFAFVSFSLENRAQQISEGEVVAQVILESAARIGGVLGCALGMLIVIVGARKD